MADEKDKPRDGEGHGPDDTDISASPRPRVSPSPHPSVSASPHHRVPVSPLYGVMAEFDNPRHLVAAAHRTYEAGYRRINGYSPYPIEELWEAIGFHHTRLPLIVLIGGIIGGLAGFLMQYYLAVFDYPLNVGGKPFNSWPAFIPITFEMTILCAAFAAVLGCSH